jgi:hypothetical protein
MIRKWNLPLTYPPKIDPVRKGECTQTIRILNKTKAHPEGSKKEGGDLIRFFTWTGKPYRSKREWVTKEYAELWMAQDIVIIPTGFLIYHTGKFQREINWDSLEMRDFATWDYIVPPTGEALRDVLMAKNKIPAEGADAQILRWSQP